MTDPNPALFAPGEIFSVDPRLIHGSHPQSQPHGIDATPANAENPPQHHQPQPGSDAARLGYDVNEIFQVDVPSGFVLPSQQFDAIAALEQREWGTNFASEEEIDSWKLDYVPSGNTILDEDAILHEDGRTYHSYKEGAYFFPNDGEEKDRLDLQHHAMKLAYRGKLATAPIPSPFVGNVLDIGTGTGLWALEFAEENSDANVIGVDLSSIQPALPTIPNCSFLKQDVEDNDWILGPDQNPVMFDYVHARYMMTCFNSHLKVMQNAYANMNPGGWIEFQDGIPFITSPDGSHHGTVYNRIAQLVVEGGARNGRDFTVTTRYKDLLREAGFVDITERHVMIPLGLWPKGRRQKQIGQYMSADVVMFTRTAGKLLRKAGVSEENFAKLPNLVKKDCMNPHIRSASPLILVCGRKPFDREIQPNKRQRTEQVGTDSFDSVKDEGDQGVKPERA